MLQPIMPPSSGFVPAFGRVSARRESVPRRFDELTSDQRRAALHTIRLVQWIAARRRPRQVGNASGLQAVVARLNEERFNHNVLIDGGRGSGKTSVLLSVLKYWTTRSCLAVGEPVAPTFMQAFDRVLDQAPLLGDPEAPEHTSRETVDPTPALILPLPILDLQPMPPTTDLRVLIASRLRRVMEEVSSEEAETTRWAPRLDKGQSVWETWATFRDSAAIGSDHIHARRAHLDSETYAVELEQAEYHRHVVGAFGRFVDALRDAYMASPLTAWGRYRPFFLLPIDDADMNPQLAAHLVETINLLSHDDVGYLLTGDSDLFLLVLREQLAGGLRHSLRSVDLEHDDSAHIGDLIYLRSLAHQIYDKHIPNGHRSRIEALPGSERVRRLGAQLSATSGIFEALPGETSSAADGRVTRDLGYYFDLPAHQTTDPPPGANDLEDVESLAAPATSEWFTDDALPETLRGIADAGEFMLAAGRREAEHRHGEQGSTIAQVVRHLWRERLNSSLLRAVDRRELMDVVRIEQPDPAVLRDAARRWYGMEQIVIQNARLERSMITRTLRSGELQEDNRWALREIIDYEFRLRDEQTHGRDDLRSRAGGTGGHGLLLPGSVGAALILATDVAADLPSGTFIGRALSPEELDAPFVVTSVFSSREGEYIEFPWPLPDWDSFRDFHTFSAAWAQIVAHLEPNEGDQHRVLDAFVYPFVALVGSIAHDRDGSRHQTGAPAVTSAVSGLPATPGTLLQRWLEEGRRQPGRVATRAEQAWRDLFRSFHYHLFRATPRFRRTEDVRHWFRNRLMLLAAPESGLSPAMADGLLKRLSLEHIPRFDVLARGARIARAKRARVSGGKEMSTPLRSLYGDKTEAVVDDLLADIDSLPATGGEGRSYGYPRHLPTARPHQTGGRDSSSGQGASDLPTSKSRGRPRTPGGKPAGASDTSAQS